jgi:pimeloyl-ACP methyl ester carboxylesterase
MSDQILTRDKIDTNGLKLHYVTEGEGDLMLFLHGFPEFWYSWWHQISEFAKDYKVVAIDLRGYNDSDKPQAQSAYVMTEFVEDVKGVIEGLGYGRCILVGHDWGGAIAWSFSHAYPELVSRLIVMNIPHPAKFAAGLKTLQQMLKSWYIAFFQIPFLPELLIQLDDYRLIEEAFRGMAIDQSAFTDEDIEEYKNAFAKRGVLISVINYYRNLPDYLSKEQVWDILTMPTLLIWGEEDKALGKELTYGTEKYVQDLRIRYIPNCSHWVQQEQPQLVNQLMREFLIEE